MTKHDELKYRQDTVESFLQIIDDLKRQIAKEERPRVGDTVLLVEDYDGHAQGSIAEVLRVDRDGTALLKFGCNDKSVALSKRFKVLDRATYKPRRWYSQAEFITFMFAHPVILVRNNGGSNARSGRPSMSDGQVICTSLGHDVYNVNFRDHEYSTDGKTWEAFGVECES